jgi:hypothetical protein
LLGLHYHLDGSELIVLHNLAPGALHVNLEIDGRVLGDSNHGPTRSRAVDVDGHGYRWLRVVQP